MVNTEDKPIVINEGLLTTVAYKLKGNVHYAIEGSIYSCGNIIKWLRDKMHFFNSAHESEKYLNINGDTNNVLFLPAFNGLGAPFWNSDIRGGFYGITQDTTINDMVTSAFNSISFQTKEITTILEKYDIKINNLLVDGGMVQNKTFCQMLSNALNKEILTPVNVESTAIGACKVCMLSSEIDINNLSKEMNSYRPDSSLQDVNLTNFDNWKSYVSKSIETI